MRVVAAACLVLAAGLVHAAPGRLLVISGIGGGEEYSHQFSRWALEMVDAGRDRLGLPAENIIWLCEAPRTAQGRCAGESRLDAVLEALSRLMAAPPGDAPVMVLLIGHGSAREGRALFNLPGPDLSARRLADALDEAPRRPVAVVNTSPASAPFVAALSRPGRVVVTATAHAAEDDHTRFAGQFVAAYAGSAADADKDGRVSLLEAFRFAVKEVEREYTARQQLATEHAMLDDDGDGAGSREPGADAGDGVAASRFHLAAAPAAMADSPQRLELELQTRAIVAQVAALRRRKAAMAPRRYEDLLEALLVALALNRRAVEELGS